MSEENPFRDQLQAWVQVHPTNVEEDYPVDIIRFLGFSKGVRKEDFNGSFLEKGPEFDFRSEAEPLTVCKQRHQNIPNGLVSIVYGSLVDVTDQYPYDWKGIPQQEFSSPPTPIDMRRDGSGAKKIDYSMLFMLSQNEHPGVFARFLISGTPLDYSFWNGRKVQKQREFRFVFKGERYSFKTVPAIQVAMQGLIDVSVDPGVLIHAMYRANLVQVDLLRETLQQGVELKKETPKTVERIMQQEMGMLRGLEQELSKYAKEPLPIYIVDQNFSREVATI